MAATKPAASIKENPNRAIIFRTLIKQTSNKILVSYPRQTTKLNLYFITSVWATQIPGACHRSRKPQTPLFKGKKIDIQLFGSDGFT